MNPAEIAASPLAAPAADITIWSMFWGAHIVVKIVMVGLLAASVWCWAIIIDKTLLFRAHAPRDGPLRRKLLVGQFAR